MTSELFCTSASSFTIESRFNRFCIRNKFKLKGKYSDNHGKIRLIMFTLSEREQDYYYQKANIGVASRIVKRLKTQGLRKVGKFKKIPAKLVIDSKVLSRPPKRQFLTVVLQSWDYSSVKHFIKKPMFLNFVDLFTKFSAWLYYKRQMCIKYSVSRHAPW